MGAETAGSALHFEGSRPRREAGLDLGPAVEAHDVLVGLEIDAFSGEIDLAGRQAAENLLHRAHRVDQHRDAVDRDAEAHLLQ